MYWFYSRLFRTLLVTVLLNQNKTILSRSYVEYCQYLHPRSGTASYFNEKQDLAGTSRALLGFPSLAITNRLSSGRRDPSSLALGYSIGFPNVNTKAARKPAFPSEGWYIHNAAALKVTCPWAGGKGLLCSLRKTL